MRPEIALIFLVPCLVLGCSVPSYDIPGEYVSADRYRLYNCEQVESESARVHVRASQIAAILDKFAQSDPPRNGMALWPEYARLKGEQAALQRTAVSRQCAVIGRVDMQVPMKKSLTEVDTIP